MNTWIMNKINFSPLVFGLILILFIFLYIFYLSLIRIYNYNYKYIKCEGRIIDSKIEREEDEDRGTSYVKYFLIKYTIKNENLPREMWYKLNKNVNIGDVITFRYNPLNPDELVFNIINIWCILLIIIIPGIILLLFIIKINIFKKE